MTMLLAALLFLFSPAPAPQPVIVEVTSSQAGGQLRLAVYENADSFAEESDVVVGVVDALAGNSTQLRVELPGPGHYVFAAFQDLNGNGKLDRNFLGVPTEPYGFTRTPSSKWRPPSFGEVASSIDSTTERLQLTLRQWREY